MQALDTPFTFKGYASNDWLMELPVHHTEIDPEPTGVLDVKDNPSQLQVRGMTHSKTLFQGDNPLKTLFQRDNPFKDFISGG